MNTIRLRLAVCSMLLILCCCISPALSGDTEQLPLDDDNNDIISDGELSTAIIDYMLSKYCDESPDPTVPADLKDAAYIYVKWDAKPKTVHDTLNDRIILYKPIRRAVVVNSETIETMRALDFSADHIIGVGKYTLQKETVFPEFASKENVGSVWSPDYEKIITLSPDALFIYGKSSKSSCDKIQEKIESINPSIRVFRFDCFNPAYFKDDVEALAEVIDREEESKEFIDFYTSRMDRITEIVSEIPDKERVKVYFEGWDDYKSCAKGSGYHEKIKFAGGKNIFENATPAYPFVNPESILFKNPDVIIKLEGAGPLKFGGYEDDDYTKTIEVYNSLLTRTGWDNITAVSDENVYIIHSDVFGGVKHFVGIAYLAKWFYPDKFTDLNPKEIHQEYLSRFQHLDYDLNEHGVFVYTGN